MAAAPVRAGELPLHAARADLLDRAGQTALATEAWSRAIETTENGVLRAELIRRVQRRSAR